jgi:hypothetical protein
MNKKRSENIQILVVKIDIGGARGEKSSFGKRPQIKYEKYKNT